MKILHVSSEKSWRGGEQQIAYLIAESLRKGVPCHVFLRSGSAFRDWASKEGVPFREGNFSNAFDLRSAWKLKRYAESEKVDLIHLHSGKGHGIYALATLLGLRTPTVLSRRVDFPVKSNPWAHWKYNLASIKRIVCVSDAIKVMTSKALRDPQKAITIHSGVDLSRFSGLQKSDKLRKEFLLPATSTLIGNVSALAPHKDYGTFIQTAKLLLDQGIEAHFFIIGEGEERPHIEALVKESGYVDRIFLTGFREDVPQLLHDLDIFLITSKTEGLGTTVLDAFACGTPVVATDAGGISESVIHEQTGLLCPVKSPDKLASALARVIEDEQLRQRLVKEASLHLMAFTKEETATKTIDIYAEILASSSHGNKKSTA